MAIKKNDVLAIIVLVSIIVLVVGVVTHNTIHGRPVAPTTQVAPRGIPVEFVCEIDGERVVVYKFQDGNHWHYVAIGDNQSVSIK